MSPFSPYGPTIALVFVLLVAAGKAIIEDKKRHKEDRITNNSTAHVVQSDGGSFPPPTTASRACAWPPVNALANIVKVIHKRHESSAITSTCSRQFLGTPDYACDDDMHVLSKDDV